MRSISTFLAVVLFILAVPALAGKTKGANRREASPLGLSLTSGGVALAGFGLDYYVTNKINLEGIVGVMGGGGGGINFHPLGGDNNRTWSPFIGLQGGVIPDIEVDLFEDTDDTQNNIYIPIGLHHIAESGFSFKLEFGYMHGFENDDLDSFDVPWMGLQLGFRP